MFCVSANLKSSKCTFRWSIAYMEVWNQNKNKRMLVLVVTHGSHSQKSILASCARITYTWIRAWAKLAQIGTDSRQMTTSKFKLVFVIVCILSAFVPARLFAYSVRSNKKSVGTWCALIWYAMRICTKCTCASHNAFDIQGTPCRNCRFWSWCGADDSSSRKSANVRTFRQKQSSEISNQRLAIT